MHGIVRPTGRGGIEIRRLSGLRFCFLGFSAPILYYPQARKVYTSSQKLHNSLGEHPLPDCCAESRTKCVLEPLSDPDLRFGRARVGRASLDPGLPKALN